MKAPEIRIAEFVLQKISEETFDALDQDKLRLKVVKQNRTNLYLFLINKKSDYSMDFFVTINGSGKCDFYDKKPEQACYHVLDLVVKGQYQGTRIDWFNE